jgi:drug/metabolite transporter (DMT)-like permease
MGLLLCLASAACFGTLAIFATLAYDDGAGAVGLLAVRFAVAAICFWVLLALRGRRGTSGLSELRGGQVLGGLALGGLGYTVQAGLFFGALERLAAAPLSLVLYTYPVIVTVAAIALRRERASARRAAALLAASAGVTLVLVGAGSGAIDGLGAAMGFGAAMTYSAYILVADGPLRGIPPLVLSTLVCTGAAAVFLVAGGAAGALDLGEGAGPAWLVVTGLFSVAAILCFFSGLERVGPSAASILSTAEPVTTVVLAVAVLGDGLAAAQLLGGVLVLGAVVVLARAPATRLAPV